MQSVFSRASKIRHQIRHTTDPAPAAAGERAVRETKRQLRSALIVSFGLVAFIAMQSVYSSPHVQAKIPSVLDSGSDVISYDSVQENDASALHPFPHIGVEEFRDQLVVSERSIYPVVPRTVPLTVQSEATAPSTSSTTSPASSQANTTPEQPPADPSTVAPTSTAPSFATLPSTAPAPVTQTPRGPRNIPIPAAGHVRTK